MVVEGPLAPWVAGMAERLNALGYARSTTLEQLRLVGKLSQLLQRRGLATDQLSAAVVEEFCRDLRSRSSSRSTPKTFAWLIEYLTEAGATPAPLPPAPQSQEE